MCCSVMLLRTRAGIAVNPVTGAWSGTPSSFLSQTAVTVRALNEFGNLDAAVDVQVIAAALARSFAQPVPSTWLRAATCQADPC